MSLMKTTPPAGNSGGRPKSDRIAADYARTEQALNGSVDDKAFRNGQWLQGYYAEFGQCGMQPVRGRTSTALSKANRSRRQCG